MKTVYFYKDKNIMIGVDNYQWILRRNLGGINPKTKKKGRTFKGTTYHATLESTLMALVEQEVRLSMGNNKKPVLRLLGTLKSYITEITKDIERKVDEFKANQEN